MDKSRYLTLRKQFDLSKKPSAIIKHYLREVVLISAIWLIWNHSGESVARYGVALLVASILFRNFSMMHDAVHKSAFKPAWINELIGIISGGICLLPFEQWRRSHLEHHTWSGNLDKDPVTAFITIFPRLPKGTQKGLNLFWKSWFPALAIVQYLVFWALAAKISLQNRMSLKLSLSLLSPVAVWSLAAFIMPKDFLLGALLPGAILYFIAVEVVNFPHHLQLPQYRGETRFHFWEQYKISRSCIYPKWFATWVVLNFNYHTEHHLFPEVPWYHLPQLQKPIQDILGEAYNSDIHFGWIAENRPKNLEEVIEFKEVDKVLPNRKAS